ncbi:MAG: hypothetical protein OXL34_11075 [Gemmatimonadota bacterium]|nr:hypothetical protein [Gemmatimonadota bacterium]
MSREDLKARIDVIEEGYEFFLAYAAQGLTDDGDSKAGPQVREYLGRYGAALDGLDEAFRPHLPAGDTAEAALAVLKRDAEASRALVGLVAGQARVSSQLIDNLNASIHLRALLTDVFVLGEMVGV